MKQIKAIKPGPKPYKPWHLCFMIVKKWICHVVLLD